MVRETCRGNRVDEEKSNVQLEGVRKQKNKDVTGQLNGRQNI